METSQVPGRGSAVWAAAAAFVVALFVFLGLAAGELEEKREVTAFLALEAGLAGLAVFGAARVLRRPLARAAAFVASAADEFTEHLDGPLARNPRLPLLAVSFAGLFAELMLVRWHASLFQIFAFFKNATLFAVFLGLGIGFALDRKRVHLPAVPLLLALQLVPLHLLRGSLVLTNPVKEELGMGFDTVANTFRLLYVLLFLLITFAATAVASIPLGHATGRLMNAMPRLKAYGVNLLGALFGVLAFAALSELWTPPPVWLAVLALALVPLCGPRRPVLLATVPSLALLAWLAAPLYTVRLPWIGGRLGSELGRQELYSPYQVLAWTTPATGYLELQVNHVYFQGVLDLGKTRAEDALRLVGSARHYNLPFRLCPRPESVVVVGSGLGNDVAAAVRNGAGHVTAVEIDPAIIELGRKLHPEHPYSNPRVTVVRDDARSFLRNTDEQYDLVLYGLLDSHTTLGTHSPVRLDSFVYTVEAFREARARLKPDGMLILSFCVVHPELGAKIYRMLEEAFDGRPPQTFATHYDFGVVYVQGATGRIPEPAELEPVRTAEYSERTFDVDPSTDDWPFFYMPVRRFPVSYLAVVAALLVASAALLRGFLPPARDAGDAGAHARFDAHFFLLGAGFMLVEAKGITELALAAGNTSQVLAAIITGVLLLAYLANLAAARLSGPAPAWAYAGLLLALLAGYAVHPERSALPAAAVAVSSALLLLLPVFFAGIVFSSSLRARGSIGSAFSSNLFGAMVGGFLEYGSMALGFRALYLVAAGAYALAWIASRRGEVRTLPS